MVYDVFPISYLLRCTLHCDCKFCRNFFICVYGVIPLLAYQDIIRPFKFRLFLNSHTNQFFNRNIATFESELCYNINAVMYSCQYPRSFEWKRANPYYKQHGDIKVKLYMSYWNQIFFDFLMNTVK